MTYAASAVEALNTVHTLLYTVNSTLGMTAFSCPSSASIDTIQSINSFDCVIVGAGEAGSILAYRLAETSANVLVLEEGGCPPLESAAAGYFTMLPNSTYDRKMPVVDDGYSNQNQKHDKSATAGVMLGGTGSLNHLIYVPPFADDYTPWVTAANDSSWGYEDIAYYFAKGENVLDADAVAQNTTVHGRCGPTKITKQSSPETLPLIQAHEELLFPYVADAYGGVSISEPLLYIGDQYRQSGHVAYLSKIASLKSNVRFLTGAVATKILFDGTTATGVQFTYDNATYSVTAGKVILTAGVIKTPQLLMVSGVGDKEALEELSIESVVDNPEVGQNMRDHAGALTAFSWDSDEVTVPADPRKFPVPFVTAYDSINKRASLPSFQSIGLYFTPANQGLLQLLTEGFKYNDGVVDSIYEGNINKTLYLMVNHLMHPESLGSVRLSTNDVRDNPIITLGTYSDDADLDLMAQHLTQYVKPLLDTEIFSNFGASLVDVGFCSNYTEFSYDFWKCYALEMSTPMRHFCGTAAIGKVVDANLNVIGTTNLKIGDASVFPSITTGIIGGTVRAVAEKLADLIKAEDGLTEIDGICKPFR